MKFADYRSRVQRCSALQTVIWWIIVRSIARFVFWLLYRQRFFGRSKLPVTGPAIYVANHQAHYDPPLVACLVGPYAPLARDTLFDTQPWRFILTDLGSIRLRKGRGDAGAMRAAINELKAGGRVLLFPEGERTHDGSMAVFQSGMMVLVRRTGVPVVPIAIEGAFDIWPRKRKYPRLRGRLAASIGHPIPAEELTSEPPEVAMERLRRAIDAMRLELRRELRDATDGRFPAAGPGDQPCADT
ncbi:MAG: lysophospholipid acyltransferase family protein [Planctomycetota bacterium]|jgi:1-acyl-sn-glycerol-3-phosphate acyltransferase